MQMTRRLSSPLSGLRAWELHRRSALPKLAARQPGLYSGQEKHDASLTGGAKSAMIDSNRNNQDKGSKHGDAIERIAAPTAQIETVLELTNLNRVLRSHDSADSAFDAR